MDIPLKIPDFHRFEVFQKTFRGGEIFQGIEVYVDTITWNDFQILSDISAAYRICGDWPYGIWQSRNVKYDLGVQAASRLVSDPMVFCANALEETKCRTSTA